MIKRAILALLKWRGYGLVSLEAKSRERPLLKGPEGYETFWSYANPLWSPWTVDEDFSRLEKAVEAFPVVSAEGMRPNRYILSGLVRHALNLEGDFIEIGVHMGYSAHMIAFLLDEHAVSPKTLFAIDSFEGFPTPDEFDDNIVFSRGGHNNTDYERVKAELSTHKCAVKVIKGFVPKAFDQMNASARFAFAHIDVDLHQSTMDALAYVYDRMVPGGIILFDDYGFPMCQGARKAVDDFMSTRKEMVVPLPTGQSFLIKT